MKKDNEEELLELMREQKFRAQNKQEEAASLRKWAGGLSIIAFWVFLAMFVLQPSEDSIETADSSSFMPFIWMIGILLILAGLFWVASYFREP